MPNIQILNPDGLGKPLGQYSQHRRASRRRSFCSSPARSEPTRTARRPPISMRNAASSSPISARRSPRRARASPISSSSPPISCMRRTLRSSWPIRTREFPNLFTGGAYPPNTLLIIDRLVREEFLIEVSAVAAL